jgi:hypothetical protein
VEAAVANRYPGITSYFVLRHTKMVNWLIPSIDPIDDQPSLCSSCTRIEHEVTDLVAAHGCKLTVRQNKHRLHLYLRDCRPATSLLHPGYVCNRSLRPFCLLL